MNTQTIWAETPVYGGYVIGRDGKVIFIKGAVPGELVEVDIFEKKRDYSLAAVTGIIEPSDFRRAPQCSLFGICGGCHLQFIEYTKQVAMKEEVLLDTIRRIGGIEIALSPSITGSEFGYRHRAQFKVSPDGKTGFYREGTRDVAAVGRCPVMTDEINRVLGLLKGVDLTGIRELHITSGDSNAALVRGNVSENIAECLYAAGISGVAFDNRESEGKDYVTFGLNDLRYSITPWSFFQSNWSLNVRMVDEVVNRMMPLEGLRVLDLYAGAGNFSLPLSVHAKEVVAVEENSDAVEDGRRNLTLNRIKNAQFINMPVEEALSQDRKGKAAKAMNSVLFDSVILDPPRPGLTSNSLRGLMNTGCRKIAYISCNPATLARDIKKMSESYSLESLTLVDLFPNTYHIEALAVLGLR